jgi:hypothetical protein
MSRPLTTDADHMVTALRAVPGAFARTYVVPERRIMFNSLNKNACTSLKWMMAHIAGEDLSAFSAGLNPFTGEAESVHDRSQWKACPQVQKVAPEIRAQIHPDNGWFVFAVIRDPRVRVFSAWQNKMLIDNPAVRRARGAAWYPRHPADTQTVVEDFARFVDLLGRRPERGIRVEDSHFRDQIDLLAPQAISYTRIYDISEMATLRADVAAHMESTGWSGELHLPRSNSMPLRANARVFGNGVREQIEEIYAADFAAYGDRWDFSPIESAAEWTQPDLAQIDLLAGYGRRIGDLRAAAISYRDQAETYKAETAKHAARIERLTLRVERAEKRPIVRMVGRWIRRLRTRLSRARV